MAAGPDEPEHMGRTMISNFVLVLACLAGLLAVAAPAGARARPSAASSSGGAQGGTGEVAIQVQQFGAGGLVRLGDWCGVQLGITDRTTRVRGLIVRLSVPDADGDTAFMQVSLAANPNVLQKVWLYTRLPFGLGMAPLLTIQAFESEDAESGGVRAGRQVGSLVYRVQGLVPSVNGLTATVGQPTLGLEQYSVRLPNANWAPTGHELWERPLTIKPADLPDRWMGLAPLGVVLWSGSGASGDPAELTRPQAEAMKEWVVRGGHLVVTLPRAGQTWTNAPANPLYEITPRVLVTRNEAADLNAYRRLLVQPDKDGRFVATLPKKALVQSFVPVQGATDAEATPILAGPEGDVVVMRRIVGAGAVSLVGFDLSSQALAAAGGIDADVFWHRVLGRRGPVESAEQLNRMSVLGAFSGDPAQTGRPSLAALHNFSSRTERPFDRGFAAEIAKKGESALGLLLAFVVFAIYWLVAGPLGFALLKRRSLTQHAWVSFLLATAAFTAIAWGGAQAIKINRVEGSHLTILDHVYGQPVQRAKSWVSLLLPTYGDVDIRVGSTEDVQKNVIAAWEPPGQTAASQFLDARGYPVDARAPSVIRVPARSTVKQFQIDWAGGPPWKMPVPVLEATAGQVEAGGRLVLGDREPNSPWIVGKLRHDLPGELTDVTILVVRGQDLRRPTHAKALLCEMQAWSLGPRTWRPGQVLDLTAETASAAGRQDPSDRKGGEELLNRFMQNDERWNDELGEDSADRLSLSSRILALSLFPLLEPPQTLSSNTSTSSVARRRLLHGWDLARWATQPSVIIIGSLADSTIPEPLSVDGSDPESTSKRIKGVTFVRWVYPLPGQPPSVKQADQSDEDRKGETAPGV